MKPSNLLFRVFLAICGAFFWGVSPADGQTYSPPSVFTVSGSNVLVSGVSGTAYFNDSSSAGYTITVTATSNLATGSYTGNLFDFDNGSLTNSGTLSTDQATAISITHSGTVTNASTGSINSNYNGVAIGAGMVNNSGYISGSYISVQIGDSSGATVTNSGTISNGEFGVLLYGNDGTVINSGTGVISGSIYGVGTNQTGTVTNFANIYGGTVGVLLIGGGAVTNSGSISSDTYGVYLEGTGTVTNSGTISGGGAAIAGDPGITVIDSGTIIGGTDAIHFTGGGNTLELQSGYSITGLVVANSGDTLTLAGATNASFDVSQIGATAQYQGFSNYLKIDSGTWTLTGSTTAVTPWMIKQGTLSVSSDGNLGSTAGTLTLNTGTLETTASFSSTRSFILGGNQSTLDTFQTDTGTLTLSGNIGGGGNLTKTGAGTLILDGINSYNGGTTISAGTVVVNSNEALGSGDVTLTGGTMTTLGSGGARTIFMYGNYVQSNGSTLSLNIYGTNSYDFLNLAGTATLGGTLNLVFDTTSFTPGKGQQYTVVTTGGGIDPSVSDMYLNPETNLAALKLVATGTITDGGDDFTVTVNAIQQNFSLNGLNPNQQAVANNLNGYINNVPTGENYSPLIVALDQVSGNQQTLASSYNQLMPLNFANFASSTAFNNASFTTQAFDNYLANHRGADGIFVGSQGGIDYSGLAVNDPNIDIGLQSVRSRLLAWSPAPSTGLLSDSGNLVLGGIDMKDVMAQSGPTNLWNVFITGNVVLAQDFSDNQAGLPYSSTTTGAVQIGADYKITPHWLIGATFGYGHTHGDLDNLGSNANVNTYSPGVYTSYTNNGWYANALGSYGFASYSQNRNVSIGAFNGSANSSPGGNQIVGDLDGGYDFHRGNWTFGPTSGLQYVHLNVDGYAETGLPGADLTVNRNESNSLRSMFGGRLSYAVKSGGMLFTPHLSASWQHEFMDQSRGITSQFNGLGSGSFVVDTANPSRDSALVDIGFDGQINNTITVFTDYAVQAGQSNYFGQSVQAGVKIGF